MNLLLVTQDFPPRPGGMARYYADLARGLGDACTVAAGGWDGRPAETAGTHRMLALPFTADASHRPWNLFRAARALDAAIRREPPDALLCGNIRPFGPEAARLARRRDLPLVQIYHGNDLLRTARRWKGHPFKHRLWGSIRDTARLHVVNSAYTAGLAAGAGLPADRIAVVPPEVDTERFRPVVDRAEREATRNRLGWPRDEPITLFVGRLVERKGLEDLLQAMPLLSRDTRLMVAGPGPTDDWRRRAAQTGLGERVRFLGLVENRQLPELYRAADLVAGPSRDRLDADDVEGFGIVFLEAAASGVAVLATRAGGIPEAVEDTGNGLLVPPSDPKALAGAWDRLLEDDALRRRLGARGREGRARDHGPGSSARRLLEALATIGIA